MTKEDKIVLFEAYKKQHLENITLMDRLDPVFGIGNDYSDRLGFTMDGWMDALAFVYGDTEGRLCEFVYEGDFGKEPYDVEILHTFLTVKTIYDVLQVIELDRINKATTVFCNEVDAICKGARSAL